jgi:hypothetical protein
MLLSLRHFAAKIREINHRYSKPHIEMSFWVKFSLMTLRIYLFVLVGLILYKFVVIVN